MLEPSLPTLSAAHPQAAPSLFSWDPFPFLPQADFSPLRSRVMWWYISLMTLSTLKCYYWLTCFWTLETQVFCIFLNLLSLRHFRFIEKDFRLLFSFLGQRLSDSSLPQHLAWRLAHSRCSAMSLLGDECGKTALDMVKKQQGSVSPNASLL